MILFAESLGGNIFQMLQPMGILESSFTFFWRFELNFTSFLHLVGFFFLQETQGNLYSSLFCCFLYEEMVFCRKYHGNWEVAMHLCFAELTKKWVTFWYAIARFSSCMQKVSGEEIDIWSYLCWAEPFFQNLLTWWNCMKIGCWMCGCFDKFSFCCSRSNYSWRSAPK